MAFCSNCGTQYQDGTRFCPRCGAAAQPAAPPVYAPPPQQAPYGGYAPPPQAPYANYAPPPQPMPYNNMMQGQQRYGSKSKSRAIFLAFFFSFFSWLYTYKRDGKKFWTGLILYLISVFTLYGGIWLYEIQLIIFPAIWLWALITALTRSSEWYAQY